MDLPVLWLGSTPNKYTTSLQSGAEGGSILVGWAVLCFSEKLTSSLCVEFILEKVAFYVIMLFAS